MSLNASETDQRPLILFVAPYFPPGYYGGVVQVYRGLLDRLARFRVVVVSDRQACSLDEQARFDKDIERNWGYSVKRMDAIEFHIRREPSERRISLAWRSLSQLIHFYLDGRQQWRSLLNDLQPDVVVCGGTYSAGWLMQILPESVPLINYVHGEELTMQLRPVQLMRYMRRQQMRCLRHARFNVVVSRYTAELVCRLSGASPTKTVLIRNFVDTRRFAVSGRRRNLRIEFGWDSRLVLLTLARLESRKGIDQALRAISTLVAQNRLPGNCCYVIAGKGSQREELQTLAEQLGIAHRVFFHGYVKDEDVPNLYQAADIFLQPNRDIDGDTEGFGIVFLEASACGLPVIGGRAGGTADAIIDAVTGYRVDGESVEEIASALDKLVNNPELRLTLGRNGAERVLKSFTVESAAAKFEDTLDAALSDEWAPALIDPLSST